MKSFLRSAGATGAEGAAAPVAQTVRGQHGGSKLPFFIKTYICYSCTVYLYFEESVELM